MKLGIKRILSGVVVTAFVTTMAIPATAAELTIKEQMEQVKQTTISEETTADLSSFSDVPSTHWAYKNIMAMTSKGLFSGTTTPVNGVGTFAPDKTMTRAEFVTVVMRAM